MRSVTRACENWSSTIAGLVVRWESGHPRFGFVEHTEETFFAGQGFDLRWCEPSQSMRFITHLKGSVRFGNQQKPDIVVFVGAFNEFSR